MGDEYPVVKVAAVQAASVFLDREGSTEKACRLIREAGRKGARVIGFPEGFIPAHPVWYHHHAATGKMANGLAVALFKNSVEIPGPEIEALCGAALEANAYVVLGVCEKLPQTIGTMFNTQVYIGPDGKLIGKHQKIMPTVGERLVHMGGFGDTFGAFQSEFGPMSGLICGENCNPLAVFALTAEGTRIHVMSWPNYFPIRPHMGGLGDTFGAFQSEFGPMSGLICGENCNPLAVFALTAEGTRIHVMSWPNYFPISGDPMRNRVSVDSQAFAQMSKAFVISACGTVDEDMIAKLRAGPEAEKFLRSPDCCGGSVIVAPNSRILAGPMGAEEGILYAECNLEIGISMKLRHDFAGHYNRPDIFRLEINRGLPKLYTVHGSAEAPRLALQEVHALPSQAAESAPAMKALPGTGRRKRGIERKKQSATRRSRR